MLPKVQGDRKALVAAAAAKSPKEREGDRKALASSL